MHRVVFAPEADRQLVELYRYVALRGSATVVTSFIGAVVDYCARPAHRPIEVTSADDRKE